MTVDFWFRDEKVATATCRPYDRDAAWSGPGVALVMAVVDHYGRKFPLLEQSELLEVLVQEMHGHWRAVVVA